MLRGRLVAAALAGALVVGTVGCTPSGAAGDCWTQAPNADGDGARPDTWIEWDPTESTVRHWAPNAWSAADLPDAADGAAVRPMPDERDACVVEQRIVRDGVAATAWWYHQPANPFLPEGYEVRVELTDADGIPLGPASVGGVARQLSFGTESVVRLATLEEVRRLLASDEVDTMLDVLDTATFPDDAAPAGLDARESRVRTANGTAELRLPAGWTTIADDSAMEDGAWTNDVTIADPVGEVELRYRDGPALPPPPPADDLGVVWRYVTVQGDHAVQGWWERHGDAVWAVVAVTDLAASTPIASTAVPGGTAQLCLVGTVADAPCATAFDDEMQAVAFLQARQDAIDVAPLSSSPIGLAPVGAMP